MPRIRAYVTACAVILALVVVALVLLVSFADLGLSGHGVVALFVGALLTIGLAMALMGLLFMSDSSGYDASADAVAAGRTSAGTPNRDGEADRPAGDSGGRS